MIPVFINSPEPMAKTRVMTTKDYSEKALKTLHRLGVLHVEESEELNPVDRAAISSQRREVSKLLACMDSVLAYIPEKERVALGEDIIVTYVRPFSELDSEVAALYTRLTNLHQGIVGHDEELNWLIELKRYFGALAGQSDFRLKDLSFSGGYLFSRVFALPSEIYETSHDKIKGYLLVSNTATVENETVLYVIARTKDQKIVESLVTDTAGKILKVPDEDLTLREFLGAVDGKIHDLEEELSRLHAELQSKTRENLERIALLRETLLAENERLSVLEKACEAKYVTLVEGWIPESNVESAISELKENIGYVFVDIREPEQAEEPPTRLRNPSGFKPFQSVVDLFGTPKYREWDPTPIVAYSFAIFFGLMAADVVYAIGIILGTRFLLGKFVDDPETDGFKLFQKLLYTCGGVALVFGLLTGNYLGDMPSKFFGVESLALVEGVQQMLGDPLKFIVLSLVLGFIHVNIAHLLGFIRGVREKGVAPGKIGLFALQIGGIPWVIHNLLGIDIPLLSTLAYSILLYLVVVGVILVIVSSVMQKGAFLGGIFWIFDITGILGDIMSYCRIAGVGLATFYLAFCFNLIADLIGGAISGIIPGVVGIVISIIVMVVILLVLHALNLFLTGLASFIHSLRLCFVEFMFKFFEGGGREYSPFRLSTRTSVLVKGGA